MDTQTSLGILEQVKALRVKQADPTTDAFAGSVHTMANDQVRADATRDVKNLLLASLGVGLAARGGVGLVNLFKQQAPKKTRSGPAMLPLPYPVEPQAMPSKLNKLGGVADFLAGGSASTKAGIPAYGPAMLLSGLAGLGLGWKGMDSVLESRRRKATEEELTKARTDFHDALLSQYDEPIKVHPSMMGGQQKAAGDDTMKQVGAALDRLFEKFAGCMNETEKRGFDWANAGGAALGGYGMYAGLSSLLAGTMVYDKMQKRSRRSILDKALQRRQRRNFAQQPTEIYAVPEPVNALPHLSQRAEQKMITSPPEDD